MSLIAKLRRLVSDDAPQEPRLKIKLQLAAHPEDLKTVLRKRHGSIAEYERKKGLPDRSVRDVLRGKSRPKVAIALASELGVSAEHLVSAIRAHWAAR